jgi:hypothetical protein
MIKTPSFLVLTCVLLALGCGDKPGADDTADSGGTGDTADSGTDTADSGTDTADSGGDTAVVEYNGTPPKQPIAAPVFSATNRDGGARDRSALIGQPTVMWFYPAAGTFG